MRKNRQEQSSAQTRRISQNELRSNSHIRPSADTTANNNSYFTKILVEVVRWSCYLALFTPLIVHPAFFFPFVVPKTIFFWIFAEISFTAWLLLAISSKSYRPSWNLITIFFSIFLGVTIFTSFTGVNIERSFWSTFERMGGAVNWTHLFLFFIAITSTFRTLEDWRKLVRTSFIATCIVAIPFLLERAGIKVIPFETRSGSTIGNSSFMATYLLFGVFFGIWLATKAKSEVQRALYGSGLGLVVLAVLLSTAFGALVSMFGGFFIVFLAWMFFGAKFKFAKGVATSLFIIGIVVAGVVGYGTVAQKESITSKLPYFFSNEGTIGARKVVWESAWQGVKERPMLGWGPENFNVVFAKYFNPCMVTNKCGGEVWFDRTHNVLLDNLVHSGILGLLSYLALFGAVFIVLLKITWRFRSEWIMPGVILAMLASYFVQNLFVFDMPSSYLMFAFTIAFAGGMANVADLSSGKKKFHATFNMPKPFTLVVVGLFFIYFLVSFGIQSLQAANWGIKVNNPMSLEEKLDLYKKSLSVSPIGNRQVPEFFTNNVISGIQDDPDFPGWFVEEIEAIMRKSTEENLLDFRHHIILGNFYNASRMHNSEYLNRAEEVLTRAVELSPTNYQGLISLSQTYMLRGENDKALDLVQKAISLEPEFLTPQLNLAEIYTALNEYEKAKEIYEKYVFSGKIPPTVAIVSKAVFVYEALGEYDEALSLYTQIVESDVGREDAYAHFRIAELYKKGGYNTQAIESAQMAKELDSGFAQRADELINSLEEVE